jgi:type I restriction enzyme S subunit
MEKQMNIPQLRFPEFVDLWDNDTLDNLTERIGDGLHGTPEYVSKSDIYFINGNNLIDGRIQINETTKKVSIETFEQNDKNLNENTLLISINGTIGSIARYNSEKVMLGKSVGYFNFKENPDFYYYLLNTSNIQNYFISELTGSTIKNLSLKTLRETKVNFPKSPEQAKISYFLKTIDEKFQALKKKHSLLEQYKKGVMQKLFSQELRFKDENGKEFPEWEEKQVKDLFKVTRGDVLAMSLVSDEIENDHIYPVYSSQTKNRGLAGYYNEYLFEDAITWTTDGAGAGDVNFREGKFYCTNVCGVLLSDEGYANLFIAELLNSVSRKYVSYVGNPKLMNNVMAEISIIIPVSVEEQQKISNFLKSLNVRIKQLEIEISKIENWKKGLLQKMFC